MIPNIITITGASSVFGRVDTEGGFVGRLKTWHEQQDPECNAVYNLGIPGDNSIGMLKRFTSEVLVRKPDIIVFSFGSNDSARNGSAEGPITTELADYARAVSELFTQAKKISTHVICISAYPIIDSKTQPYKQTEKYYSLKDFIHYVEKTKDICTEYDVPYLDIYSMFLNEGYEKYIFTDGLHCNQQGHARIFTEVQSFLTSYFS